MIYRAIKLRMDVVKVLIATFMAVSQIEGLFLSGKTTVQVQPVIEFSCQRFNFTPPFPTKSINIQLSTHENEPASTYEAAVSWVEQISRSSFTGCVATSGPIISSRRVDLQWIAFDVVPPRCIVGIQSVSLWTTGTKCVSVITSGGSFSNVPSIYLTPVHSTTHYYYDATAAWVEDPTIFEFKICLRELKNFDGMHRNIRVDWLAMEEIPHDWKPKMPYQSHVMLPNIDALTEKQHYSFCKELNFTQPFYAPPVMITTSSHVSIKVNPKTVYPENNAITEWLEDIKVYGFKVCMKDIQPYNEHHDPVTINYMTIGDLHPCINVHCNFYAYCKAFGPKDARCVCQTSCPSYEDLVCGDNGQTYQNMCFYELFVCQNRVDVKILRKGSCLPFIIHRGRITIQLETTDVQCKTVEFYPKDFLTSRRVHVQTSINYFNLTSDFVHDAAVTWTENINATSFSVCALKAGRGDRPTPDRGLTFVDYIAYQGAPRESVAGEEAISDWWDGTTCKKIEFPQDNFNTTPNVLVTAEHMATGMKHDAATLWIEDLTMTSFHICLRELQNFDGIHKDIRVNWIAYNTLPSDMMAEQRLITFPNDNMPLYKDNFAFCQVMMFDGNYTSVPTVLISAAHSTTGVSAMPWHNSIAPWIEYITSKACRMCIKELHVPHGFYPVTVTALILGRQQ